MNRISVVSADITTLGVDAIVNAANRSLCGGGGGCAIGSAKITAGYRLPARYIIHAVGPVWEGGHKNEDALLASCCRSSLELARRHEVRSIAFPAIS